MRFFNFLIVCSLAAFLSSVQADWFSSPDDKDPESCPATCLELKDTGMPICWRGLIRYYFNKDTKKCESFKYSGCGGNSNKFHSRKSCMEKCGQCRSHDLKALSASENPRCDCELEHETLGCKISVGAPAGYKCQCFRTAWKFSCKGKALPCNKPEDCPANCVSKKCCLNGKGDDGNCDGYSSWAKQLPQVLPMSQGMNTDKLIKTAENMLADIVKTKIPKLE